MCSFNRYLVICDSVYLMHSVLFIPQYTLLVIDQTFLNLFTYTHVLKLLFRQGPTGFGKIALSACQSMTVHTQLLQRLPAKKNPTYNILPFLLHHWSEFLHIKDVRMCCLRCDLHLFNLSGLYHSSWDPLQTYQ